MIKENMHKICHNMKSWWIKTLYIENYHDIIKKKIKNLIDIIKNYA
jgi:hypothetical protein